MPPRSRPARRRGHCRQSDDLLETSSRNIWRRTGRAEIARLLRRDWVSLGGRSIHDITKRDGFRSSRRLEQRGAPGAANKTLKSTKTIPALVCRPSHSGRVPSRSIPLPTKWSLGTRFSPTGAGAGHPGGQADGRSFLAALSNCWLFTGQRGRKLRK